ncbi:GRIP domain-containing protein quick-to-court isoform X1 [Temnothorax americanus]|uniref:GRIP domain-containing protein quick-to-court isoform X1 n=1 Tax=Temnothorax americanus TaxID=1964332 RepID=UPI0040687776
MDGMARYDNEESSPQSLQLAQSIRPGQSTHATATIIPTSPVTPILATCAVTATDKVTATTTNSTHVSDAGSAGSPTTTSPPSSLDSRIPRPSPSALRRAASLRLRGERLLPHHPRPTTAAVAASTALVGHQHHPRRHNHLLQSPQQHQHPDHRIFPVITENGTESPRQRSFSLSLTPVRPRPGHAASGGSTTAGVNDDSDVESVKSYSSACSTASACEHASFALNGTTWSGRSRKYVVHCSNYVGDNEQYLTPTQRAAKQVRKFQALLKEARKEIDEKDREILRLTKEVVELRLYKASLNSPDERTDSSDALTVRENNPFSPESPSKDLPDEVAAEKPVTSPETPEKRVHTDLPSSLADSGHFEDGSVHSKDSVCLPESQPEITVSTTTCANTVSDDIVPDTNPVTPTSEERDEERRRLVSHYEGRIEDMHRRHVDELQELKQKHNDKVESLLNQLSEVNTRYCEMRPAMDIAEARARELELELEAVKTELNDQKTLLSEQEERNKQMYLKMYAKGQEAARIEQADQIFVQAHQSPPKVTVAELLQQLTVTQAELENIKDTSYSPEPHISAERSQSLLSAQEAVSLWVLGTRKAMYRRIVEARSSQGTLDPEITLQFLKSAIYYFLTDKENHHGHLNAIESILGFTDAERHNIDRYYRSARK